MKRIPVSGPSITQREIDYVAEAVAHGWYENANVYQQRFERAFAARLNRRHAVAPTYSIGAAEAIQVDSGTITSSPGPMPSASSAR